VMFICTKCKQILKLDDSLTNITDNDLNKFKVIKFEDEMIPNDSMKAIDPNEDSISQMENLSIEDGLNASSELLTLPIEDHGNSSSFSIISDNKFNPDQLNAELKKAASIFDLMSGSSDVEHPLCEDCTDLVLESLNKEVRNVEKKTISYSNYYKQLNSEDSEDTDISSMVLQSEELDKENKQLLQELARLNEERQQVIDSTKEFEEEIENLLLVKKKKSQEFCDLQLKQIELYEQELTVNRESEETEAELNRLRKTNIFNATFHIWHSGPFGTINGFRLGRLPNNHVDWSEINTAWGQAALLLSSLAMKLNLEFKNYKLVPFGSHSYIEQIDDKSKELPLYASGGIRFLWNTKFDQGMVAFLDCLQQFQEELYRVNGCHLPYKMRNGVIEDVGFPGGAYSIKIILNSEEQWTKALKFMLTNLKWGLASVSTHCCS